MLPKKSTKKSTKNSTFIIQDGIVNLTTKIFFGVDIKNIDEIVFPDSVRVLESGLFYGFRQLKKVKLPRNIEYIPYRCFYYCTNLKEIDMGDCDKIKRIGMQAFYGCSKLKKVILPKNLRCIESESFCECKSLKSIELSNSVESIQNRAFKGCPINTNKIKIPKSVSSIDSDAFDFSKNDINYIGEWCFGHKKYYCDTLTIKEDIKHIANEAFEYGEYKNIILPDSVETIGFRSFGSCVEIDMVKMSKNIKQFHQMPFEGTRIKEIRYSGTIEDWLNVKRSFFASFKDLLNVKFYINDKLLDVLEIPEGVKVITEHAFDSFSCIKKIIIPDSVTTIENCAFRNTGVREIVGGRNVKCIGDCAFESELTLNPYNDEINKLELIGNDYDKNRELISYKGFDCGPDGVMMCNDCFVYVEGKTYELDDEPILCQQGFHSCTNPLEVFDFYSYDAVFHKVKCKGIVFSDSTKICCKKITILEELSIYDMFQEFNKISKNLQ